MFIIKRTENFDGKIYDKYMTYSGFSNDYMKARKFETREDAEFLIELEESDPKYEREFMGVCTFEILET